LSFVVTCAILVRLTKVAQCDGAINCRDDVRKTNVNGRLGQDVSATHATLGADKPRSLEGEKDLLEIRLRKACALGNVANRGWSTGLGMKG
jgi:hypothetical protein